MNELDRLKKALKRNEIINRSFYCFRSHFFTRNKYKVNGSGNKVTNNQALLIKSKLNLDGRDNQIIIGKNSRIVDFKFFVKGNNNLIKIGSNCTLNGGTLWIEDNNNKISIGDHTTIELNTEIACIEGCSLMIGDDCMFSSDIIVTTGDSHSIINFNGTRINHSQDVVLGNHVWVGHRVLILKGANIPSNTIIGAGSLVNKKFDNEHSIIAGSPATIIKGEVNWIRERIK